MLKKEISEKDFDNILQENNSLAAYYDSLKAINTRLRTEKELDNILKNKNYGSKDILYALDRLKKEGYLNHKIYIEAYIHDRIALYIEGENKILNDLMNLGFEECEIRPFLDTISKDIYMDKINKYIAKKSKSNKKSIVEFKRKTLNELVNKGFYKSDINKVLDNLELEEDKEVLERLINKLNLKYSKKYDKTIVKLKIKTYLYQKGYSNVDIDKYIG
ncbi:MAG: RecX family transcriptional regulator [Ruminococcus sp.]|nr:RecX family transcriptional regulator [Ruminococcus sp.]